MLSIRILAFFLVPAFVKSTKIQQKTGAIGKRGIFRYTYDEDVSDNCESVVMIGVGTGMRVENYDVLAKKISTGVPIVTVFFDHNPGNMIKYGASDYANFYYDFALDGMFEAFIPVCGGKSPKIIAGGHSGSGCGGFQAMMMYEGLQPDGFVGLDPYQASKDPIHGLGPNNAPATRIDPYLPVLFWGFERTTCMVDISIAGASAYNISGYANRVFFRVNNRKALDVGHCEFSDTGCGLSPSCPHPSPNHKDVKNVIAKSIQVFARSVVNGKIEPSDFRFDTSKQTIGFDAYVNSDEVEIPPMEFENEFYHYESTV